MAPRKTVTSLEDFCLQALQKYATIKIFDYANKEQGVCIEESKLNEAFEYLYDNLPLNTHDRFVELRLLQLEEAFDFEKWSDFLYRWQLDKTSPRYLSGDKKDIVIFLSAESDEIIKLCSNDKYSQITSSDEKILRDVALFKYLMAPVTRLKVKAINMDKYSQFIMSQLILLLTQIMSLEIFLKCDVNYINNFIVKELGKNVKILSNLTSFTFRYECLDEILAAVSENCKSICSIDVKYSSKVSNECIEHLIKCKKLQTVKLDFTLVSGQGFLKLLTQSESNSLTHVSGFHRKVNKILDQMQSSMASFPMFGLKKLIYAEVDASHLNLVSKYFPHLTELLLEFSTFQAAPLDFSSVLSIRTLKKINLRFIGTNFEEMAKVISKCPLINSVTLDSGHKSEPILCMPAEMFAKVTKLIWRDPKTLPFAKLILSLAANIESFEFSPNYDGGTSQLTNKFFASVLAENPLKDLRCLTLHIGDEDLSVMMVKRIISCCEKLRCLKINMRHSDRKTLEKFVLEHNYDIALQYVSNESVSAV